MYTKYSLTGERHEMNVYESGWYNPKLPYGTV